MTRRIVAALGWITALVLVGCGAAQATTDPRQGWVKVANFAPGHDKPDAQGVSKRCDNNGVLIYVYMYQGGIAVVPDAPECQR